MKKYPTASGLTASQIEAKAAEVAEIFNFNPEKQSVRDLAYTVGGVIEVPQSPDYEKLKIGSLKVSGHQKFTIELSPFTSPLCDNFTIAHELGHYFLHFDEGRVVTGHPMEIGRSAQSDPKLEREANRFAAALLMPKDRFTAVAERTQNNAQILAGRFDVSVQAARVRLTSLKIG